jgi:hypothetical protein
MAIIVQSAARDGAAGPVERDCSNTVDVAVVIGGQSGSEETKSFGGIRTSAADDASLVLILYGNPAGPKVLFAAVLRKNRQPVRILGPSFGLDFDSVDSLEHRRKISN